MRVSSTQRIITQIPTAYSFSSFTTFMGDDGEDIPFESTLSNEMVTAQQSSNISETFNDEIWKNILAGLERVCIVLRTQDYSHAEIAFILGMKPEEVSRILYKVRNRLIRLGIHKDESNF